jgi:hypothetical protein
VPVVYVDYPSETSYKQIYGTFNRAMLKLMPQLAMYAEPLTNAMVEFYLASQERFTQVREGLECKLMVIHQYRTCNRTMFTRHVN